MRLNRLGNSGLMVSEIAIGTGTFGKGPDWPYGALDEDTATAVVREAIDLGINLFDTADVYGAGIPQQVFGRAIRGIRDRVVISAKFGLPTGASPASVGAGRGHVISSCDAALRRLQVDHIDLFQLHVFDAGTPLEETLTALDSLVQAGKVRYFGFSNFTAWHVMKAQATARALGTAPAVSHQVYYSLVGRDIELEIVPAGLDQGLGTLVWSPLAGGWLGGDVRRGQEPDPDSRVGRLGQYGPVVERDRLDAVMDTVDLIAADTGRSPAQISINWVARRPSVASVILGVDSREQLLHNVESVSWELTAEQRQLLDDVSDSLPGYPYLMYYRDPGFSDLAPPAVPRRVS